MLVADRLEQYLKFDLLFIKEVIAGLEILSQSSSSAFQKSNDVERVSVADSGSLASQLAHV